MTAQAFGGSGSLFTFAMLVDGSKMALFTQLIAYLAFVSVIVWSLVLASTLVRIVARRMYRLRIQLHMQRRAPTD